MRKISCLFFSAFLVLSACSSSSKLLEKGRYDKAIEKAAKKLQKKPGDADELYVLKEAYKRANTFDKEEIEFLRKENREENWIEIYRLYTRLENRQNIIRSLPASVQSQFTFVDYDDKIIKSKQVAAQVSYQKGLDYLDRGDKQSARKAYEEFVRVKNIYSDYKEVDRLLREAEYLGTNFVLLRVENNSDKVLPEDFDEELRKIALGDLNTRWLRYEAVPDSSIAYDYFVVINIRDIEVSPETIEKESYTESKEIQDGMKYVLDENGNVKKDSLGNDIKEPNFITVSAEVTESIQYKDAVVGGSIDYIDLYNDRLIKTEKISVTAIFEHYSAVAVGDERALSKETRKKVGNRPVYFPPNEVLLMDAAELLKERAKAIIYRNRRLLAN